MDNYKLRFLTLIACVSASCDKADRSDPKRADEPPAVKAPLKTAKARPVELTYHPEQPPEALMRAAIDDKLMNRKFLDLKISMEKLDAPLPDTCTIDLESGSGHGFNLSFLRMEIDKDEVALEEVTWEDEWEGREKVDVFRASTSKSNLFPFLELIDVARSIKVETKEKELEIKPNPDGTIGLGNLRTIGSSVDFFVLLRIMDPEGEVIHEAEYAGYESSSDQNHYLPLSILLGESRKLTENRRAWTTASKTERRSSHLSDAFARNKAIMLKEFHWWVLEYSLKALASLGNRKALPALAFIKSEYPDFKKVLDQRCAGFPAKFVRDLCLKSRSNPDQERSHNEKRDEQLHLIGQIVAAPERFLEGPPATLKPLEKPQQ